MHSRPQSGYSEAAGPMDWSSAQGLSHGKLRLVQFRAIMSYDGGKLEEKIRLSKFLLRRDKEEIKL